MDIFLVLSQWFCVITDLLNRVHVFCFFCLFFVCFWQQFFVVVSNHFAEILRLQRKAIWWGVYEILFVLHNLVCSLSTEKQTKKKLLVGQTHSTHCYNLNCQMLFFIISCFKRNVRKNIFA